jgi:hypothetical protein
MKKSSKEDFKQADLFASLLSTEAQINRYFTARGNHKGLPPLWLPLFLVV